MKSDRVAVELCSGLGGIGIGLRALGFSVAKAYDSWDRAVAVYNHNFSGDVATCCNLLTERGRSTVVADRKQIGDVELMAAGPPCKGFSQLRNGRHDGRNGHNRVLAVMPNYVAIIRPRIFVIENVPELVRHRGGTTLDQLLARLRHPAERLAYRVEYGVFDAAMFGTPQARRRVLILGVRNEAGGERLPTPGPNLSALFSALRHGAKIPQQLAGYLERLRDPEDIALTSSSQALSDLPSLGPGEPEHPRKYASSPKNAFQRWVRGDAPLTLSNTRTPAVRPETLARLQHIPPGCCARAIPKAQLNGLSRRYGSAYRRLHPDAPSTVLSTKYDCVYHYLYDRSLSVREYARMQGIPDKITFPSEIVSRRNAYEMIGNSVPPLLIESVLREALFVAPTVSDTDC